MRETVEQILLRRSNDYEAHERFYQSAVGCELVRDPLTSPRFGPGPLELSATVVIPAWNTRNTIERCLISLESSSFNLRYPDLFEVVVVDDGSTDGTWELLSKLRPELHLRVVQQEHHGLAHARNTGISVARGDIIICCDSDQIVTPFSIEELVKRHQVLQGVMLIGFRNDIDECDPRFSASQLTANFHQFPSQFSDDYRISFYEPGWPENFCAESNHLKLFGEGKQFLIKEGDEPDADVWDLTRMCTGFLFSLRRDDCLRIGGFDERFRGWGCEDMAFAALSSGLGNLTVPVYSAFAMHFKHPDRSKTKMQEATANYKVFRSILESPCAFDGEKVLAQAGKRIVRKIERQPSRGAREVPADFFSALNAGLENADRHAQYLYYLGRYVEAADAFTNILQSNGRTAPVELLVIAGKALYAAGRYVEAIEVLAAAARQQPTMALPLVESARALAANGDFQSSHDALEQAYQREPENRLVLYILGCEVEVYLKRGRLHRDQGIHSLARQDFEAVLMREPGNSIARREREKCLASLN